MKPLGINMTDNEKETGWAQVQPVIRIENRLHALSIAAWKLASKMVDDGRDLDDIQEMQRTAVELEKLARSDYECHCVLPEQSCEACRLAARVIYEEEFSK